MFSQSVVIRMLKVIYLSVRLHSGTRFDEIVSIINDLRHIVDPGLY